MHFSRLRVAPFLSLVALSLAALSACPSDTPFPGQIRIALEGVVTDAATGTPLADVDVSVPNAGALATATTDADGRYAITFNGYEQLLVFFTKDGYASTRATLNTADTIRESPSDIVVGQVITPALFPLNGTLQVRVVGQNQANLIEGARVRIAPPADVVDANVTWEGVTGENGEVTLAGIPGGVNLTVTALATDADGDGTVDYASAVQNVFSNPDAATLVNFNVNPFVNDFLVFNTFDDVNAVSITADATFEFVYAGPMDTTPGLTTVNLTRDGTALATLVEWSDDALTLTVAPRAPMVSGQEYLLTVNTVSANGVGVNFGPRAFTVDGNRVPGAVQNVVVLSEPDEVAFFNPTIRLGFDPVAGATSYRVYANNSGAQRDLLRVATVAASDLDPVNPELSLTLPAQFRSVPNDTTPFGFGETLSFFVVAAIGNNEGTFPATPVTVADERCPDIVIAGRSNNWNNTSTTDPLDVEIVLQSNEWIPLEAAQPALTFAHRVLPGAPVPLANASFTLERSADRRTLTLKATLLPETDARFVNFTVAVAALLDASGNAPCDVAPQTQITEGGEFALTDDFESGPGGFQGNGPWALGTPVRDVTTHALAPQDASSGTNAWGTNLIADYDDSAAGTLTLSSRVFSPPPPGRTLNFSVSFVFAAGAGDNAAVFWVSQDNSVNVLIDNLPRTGSNFVRRNINTNAFTTGAGPGRLEFRLVHDGQETAAAGLFIDDFSYQANY